MKSLRSIYGFDSYADRVASRNALGTATCTIHVSSVTFTYGTLIQHNARNVVRIVYAYPGKRILDKKQIFDRGPKNETKAKK